MIWLKLWTESDLYSRTHTNFHVGYSRACGDGGFDASGSGRWRLASEGLRRAYCEGTMRHMCGRPDSRPHPPWHFWLRQSPKWRGGWNDKFAARPLRPLTSVLWSLIYVAASLGFEA